MYIYPQHRLTLLVLLLSCLTITIAGCADEQAHDSNITAASAATAVTVYKSPTCGCCADWVEHIEGAGFQSLVEHPSNLDAIKAQFNIPAQYQSCHTAVHGEFVFEGHIPVKYIQQFLDNPPAHATGLAVPAMPLGSPGMEAGKRFTPYTIYQLNADGKTTVFAKIARLEEQY